jgi:hypothetical protein
MVRQNQPEGNQRVTTGRSTPGVALRASVTSMVCSSARAPQPFGGRSRQGEILVHHGDLDRSALRVDPGEVTGVHGRADPVPNVIERNASAPTPRRRRPPRLPAAARPTSVRGRAARADRSDRLARAPLLLASRCPPNRSDQPSSSAPSSSLEPPSSFGPSSSASSPTTLKFASRLTSTTRPSSRRISTP